MKLSKQQRDFLEEPIQELGLPARVVNALENKKDVLYVKQLLALSIHELEAIPNFGKKTISMIFKALAKNGFHARSRKV
jgi:DNA-directed RNA polymerase alpha subunit